MRLCIKCHKLKANSGFHRSSQNRSGRVNVCKVCKSGYDRARGQDRTDNNELLRSWGKRATA